MSATDHLRRPAALCVVGIALAAIGILSLRAAMHWLWWDLAVGAVEHSARESAVRVSGSFLLILAGLGMACTPLTYRIVDRGGSR